METNYDAEKESRRRRQLRMGALGTWSTGSLMVLYGLAYPIISTPSQPLILERYEEIERELNSPPDFTLGDLETKSKGFIDYVNELRDERNKIESTLGFAEVREKYASEHENNKDVGLNITLGGIGFALLSSIPLFLSRKKTRKRSNIRTPIL